MYESFTPSMWIDAFAPASQSIEQVCEKNKKEGAYHILNSFQNQGLFFFPR